MPTRPFQLLIDYLHRALGRPGDGTLTDAQLLQRWLSQRDQAAFELLLWRHGPMVLAACRRLLRNAEDAEDAFQAVWLVLLRKAASIRRGESLPAWLHRVACRLALRSRAAAEKRAGRERPALDVAAPGADPVLQEELRAVLDEEVNGLPAHYRQAFILCCLEGKTQEEAAGLLGRPRGTVSSWLTRARDRLRDRLSRRGLALSAALVAVEDAQGIATGGMPGVMVGGVVRSAVAFAAGRQGEVTAAVGVSAQALAEGLMKEWAMTKLKVGLVLALTVGVVTAGVGAVASQVPAVKVPQGKQAAETNPAAKEVTPGKAEKEKQPARTDRFGDPLPEGALARFGSVRYRDASITNNAALSADGKLLATVSQSAVTLWELSTGRPLHRWHNIEVPNEITAEVLSLQSLVCFSSDGKNLIALGNSHLYFWDVESGRQVRKLTLPVKAILEYPIARTARLVPGGKEVVVTTREGIVYFLDSQTGEVRREFTPEGARTGAPRDGPLLLPTPGWKYLITIEAKAGKAVLFLDTWGKEIRRIENPEKVRLLALSGEGSLLATADAESVLRLYEVETGKECHSIRVPVPGEQRREWLTALALASDGKTLVAGTERGQILRWDVDGGKPLAALGGHDGRVTGLCFPPDGRSLVSVGWDSLIRRWELPSGKEMPTGDGFSSSVIASQSPDGRRVAIADRMGRMELWDTATGHRLRTLRESGPRVGRLSWSPDGRTVAVGQTDNTVGLWDPATGQEVRMLRVTTKVPQRQTWTEALAFSPDGRSLVTSFSGQGTQCWELASGAERWHRPQLGRTAFSPDGKTVAVVTLFNKHLHLLDAATGKERLSLEIKDAADAIFGVAFSPDGRALATCHYDGTIRLRDPNTGREKKCLRGHKSQVWSVSFSPDSKRLVSSSGSPSGDATVRLWEAATGKELLCRDGHGDRVYEVEFGPDGVTALSSAWDHTALLWDLRPGNASGNLVTWWDDLAGEDAAKAYQAAWAMTRDPRAVEFLRTKLSPVKAVGKRRLEQLIADLDSEGFEVREQATKELEAAASQAEPLLRNALEGKPALEKRRRVERLLEKLAREEWNPSPNRLRALRALPALERIGTSEARQVLQQLARGASEARLTQEAKSALQRLARRPIPKP